mmetsp:Transcript_11247/g.31556  ORF Transcript_11247/g.31556 Transcript_11247/m.31556 type:complete len:333 (+) Transcript_11247:34-1032(+)
MLGAVWKHVTDPGFRWTEGVTPLANVGALAMIHVAYITMIIVGLLQPSLFGRFPARLVSKFHNLALSLASLAMVVGHLVGTYQDGGLSSLDAYLCHIPKPRSHLSELVFYAFYLSKLWELFDTFLLLCLQKTPIWLHLIHHSTTAGMCFFAYRGDASTSNLVLVTNCTVHTIMYFYYYYPITQIRRYITTLQMVQFVVVMVDLLYVTLTKVSPAFGPPCTGDAMTDYLGLFFYALFLTMFGNFFRQQYQGQAKGKRAELAKPSAPLIGSPDVVLTSLPVVMYWNGTLVFLVFLSLSNIIFVRRDAAFFILCLLATVFAFSTSSRASSKPKSM